MIATFLRAEVGSSRFRDRLDQALERLGLTLDLIRFPDTNNEVENHLRRDLLVEYRGWGQEESVFGGLPADRIDWLWVDVEEPDLRERVFYIEFFWKEFSKGT